MSKFRLTAAGYANTKAKSPFMNPSKIVTSASSTNNQSAKK